MVVENGLILSEPLVALLCSNYDDVKTLRASGRHNYSSRRRGTRPSYAFGTTSRPRNWCVTVDDIEAAPLRNGIRELVPCRADQTGRPVRQESKRSSKLVKRRGKQNSATWTELKPRRTSSSFRRASGDYGRASPKTKFYRVRLSRLRV